MSNLATRPRQRTATQRVADQIRELIFSGELTADSNHLESELATRLGISRTPVREATLMLQAFGLLEVQPRKGVRIRAITVEDIHEICLVVTELKCLAAKEAANKNYSVEDLLPLSNSIDALEIAQKSNQKEDWAEAKKSLKGVLVELSANNHIAETVHKFHDQLSRVWRIALSMDSIPQQPTDAYRAVHDAILAGNSEDATRKLREHSEHECAFLMNVFDKSGLKRV